MAFAQGWDMEVVVAASEPLDVDAHRLGEATGADDKVPGAIRARARLCAEADVPLSRAGKAEHEVERLRELCPSHVAQRGHDKIVGRRTEAVRVTDVEPLV